MSSHNIALSGIAHAESFSANVARRLAWPAAAVLMILALLAPALWNGFPLIFADTGGYLLRPLEGNLDIGRSALYGAFLAPAIRLEFWPNVLVQAALAAWIIALTLRTHLGGVRPATAVLVVLGLAALTSLPWTSSQLMPDVFVPLAALALHLLAFRSTRLKAAEIAGLVGLAAFAIASHMSILGMGLALLLAYAIMAVPALRSSLPRPRLALPAAALAAGIGLALTSNAIIAGQFAFTPGGPDFLFGRLLQDGIVARYLDRVCPDPALRLCAYRDALPTSADDWMWWPGSPFYKLGAWKEFTPEAERIIAGSILTDPGAQVVTAVRDTLQQLVTVDTGDGVNAENNQHAEWALSVHAPDAMARFRAAAQQRDQFDLTAINRVQIPLALAASALMPILVVLLRRRRPALAALALSVTLALLANAAICGIFSGPNARYQSRLVPIALLTALVVVLDLRRKSRQQPDTVPG
ncbi:MAG TPA: hypothetical protein VG145_00960 [Xanthobacteraceae bacterium]|nr:hypothetical protein [Xanthobacteraceae bacterium]